MSYYKGSINGKGPLQFFAGTGNTCQLHFLFSYTYFYNYLLIIIRTFKIYFYYGINSNCMQNGFILIKNHLFLYI